MFTRIIVPLDGSPLAETALSQATGARPALRRRDSLGRVVDFTMMEKSGAFGLALEYAPPQEFLQRRIRGRGGIPCRNGRWSPRLWVYRLL